ncbi:hypothetical protein ABEB36_008142 [Hypothenemus hampei]|uniref:THAP9-like helix-turn-helix domain-containing protein n=1 Tax=Hypothenemus hampei TaxID=57062 RepID=A0ABD1EKW7_HYPHA
MDNQPTVDMDNQPVVDRQEKLSAVNVQSTENTSNDVNTEKRFVEFSTSISPITRFQSSTKEWMRKVHAKEMTALKRKLYVTIHKKKLSENKLVSLKQLLKTLRSKQLISEADFNNLKHLNTGLKQLMKREIRKRKNLSISKTYLASLRQYAITLNFYSPKAYNYVHSKFYKICFT